MIGICISNAFSNLFLLFLQECPMAMNAVGKSQYKNISFCWLWVFLLSTSLKAPHWCAVARTKGLMSLLQPTCDVIYIYRSCSCLSSLWSSGLPTSLCIQRGILPNSVWRMGISGPRPPIARAGGQAELQTTCRALTLGGNLQAHCKKGFSGYFPSSNSDTIDEVSLVLVVV